MKEKMKPNLSAHCTTMKTLTFLTSSFPSSCLWFLLVLSLSGICICNQTSDHVLCIPTERLVLIDLKNSLTNEANRLSSWAGKDCCSWSGVICGNVTGHVHEIHLRGSDYDQRLGGTISSSVIKLLQLRYLDLSYNNFSDTSIPAFFGSFQNLIYLNLSYSHFGGEIPHQLGNLLTLRVLDLNYAGSLYSKSLAWLKNLKGLQYLDMGYIDLAEASDWFPVVSNLTSLLKLHLSSCGLNRLPSNPATVSFKSLISLDLSENYFDNMILPGWIFSLHNLALLDVNGCFLSGVLHETHGGFHSMPSLRTLLLSRNNLANSTSLLNGLSSLSNLRYLDVSQCDISSPILGNLQNLSLIEHVDLSYNQILEKIPKSLTNLCKITTLDLKSNKFFGDVSELLERFCECESPKLELLDFSFNNLIGQLPERLGKLKNLIEIDLGTNNLTGIIPDSLGNLSLLQRLDIIGNQISGSIPNTIGGLSSLGSLDISNNMLNGSLPESIGQLSKLSFLDLEHNSLTGILTETHFANLTSLTTLSVGDNKLVFKLNVNNWIPPFYLQTLSAGSCSLGPQFPSWIMSQIALTELKVANANISDTIPNWFWTTFPNLGYLDISHNNIQGKLGDVISFAPGSVLDLSNNRLHGTLPGSFSTMVYLDLSNNSLSGSLYHFLCSGIQEPRPLQFLNLASNNMSGVISDCWKNFAGLFFLNLEKNQFSGIIPPSLEQTSLFSLDIDDNRLTGNLPPWLLNSANLVVIELARNGLMGKIPSSIGRNDTILKVLSLRSNKLEGKIPDEICHLSSVQILDLAHNDLSGNLPTCFKNFSVMSGSEPSSPVLFGAITTASLVTKGNTNTYSTILYQVTSLDLSDNNFSGSIPDEVVGLLALRFLNLSHNNLTGTIPNLFNQTGKLEALDLSVNHLKGNIPLSLSHLTSLNCLNLLYNNLVGRIPTGPQLQTFNDSSFTGNALCGDPLPACLPTNGDPEATTEGHDEANDVDWILVILTLAGLVFGFWSILAPLFFSRRWRLAYYHFLEEIWFKLQDFIYSSIRLTKRFRSK